MSLGLPIGRRRLRSLRALSLTLLDTISMRRGGEAAGAVGNQRAAGEEAVQARHLPQAGWWQPMPIMIWLAIFVEVGITIANAGHRGEPGDQLDRRCHPVGHPVHQRHARLV